MSPLSNARIYSIFQALLGARSARELIVRKYIAPKPGYRILDLGCGPADILAHLQDVDYVGVDHSAKYLDDARARYGDRGLFIQGEIGSTALPLVEPGFDRVLALGVIHHLDDDQAKSLFEFALSQLKPGGKLITVDGCFESSQSRVARFLLKKDRGAFVREPLAYLKLARTVFSAPSLYVRNDLLNIPYSHCLLECVSDK